MMYAWIKAKGVSIEALVMCFLAPILCPADGMGLMRGLRFSLYRNAVLICR